MSENLQNNISINDLKEMEFAKKEITPQQRLAIKNFDRYRFKVLTGIKSEEKFHSEFQRLQVQANLMNFEEFLKDEFL